MSKEAHVANAFSVILFLLALGALCLTYSRSCEGEWGEAFVCFIGALVLGASGYVEWTMPHSDFGRGVGGIIFLLAAVAFYLTGRELPHCFPDNTWNGPRKWLIERRIACLGYILLGCLFVAGAICQFVYVV